MFQYRRKIAFTHGFINELSHMLRKHHDFLSELLLEWLSCVAFHGFNCLISLYTSNAFYI